MIGTIAWHEFWFTVKRKSYYLVTLGMPLIVLAYVGLVGLIVAVSVPGEIEKFNKPIGVVDQLGLLTGPGGPMEETSFGEVYEFTDEKDSDLSDLEELDGIVNGVDLASSVANIIPTRKVYKLENLASAKALLEDETVRSVTVIPSDYMTSGKLNIYVQKSELLGSSLSVGWLSELLGTEILNSTDLNEESIKRIQGSAKSTEFEIGDAGEFEEVDKLEKGLSMGIPMAIAGVLIMALMMNSGQLLTSIAEEKENKVMEIIVSSVSADDLLFGKVIGIVCAGLLQIAIWLAMVSVLPALVMFALQETVNYELRIMPLLFSGALMILGFLFYGCLLAGLGSLGSSYKDCQQLSVVPILLACVPLMSPMLYLSSPEGMIARVMSFIPFFSPIAMTLRLGVIDVPLWEIGLAAVILLVSIFLAIKFSARLFRAGVLMQGKKPGLGMIWQVLTQ